MGTQNTSALPVFFTGRALVVFCQLTAALSAPGSPLALSRCSSRLLPEKHDLITLDVRLDAVPLLEFAFQNAPRQRVLNQPLDGPLERPRPVHGLVPLAGQGLPHPLGNREF